MAPPRLRADGNTLLLAVTRGATNALSILALPDKKETALAEELSSVNAFAAMFSPDGRSIAYSRGQVFVQPFPITGAKYLISPGFHPVWSHDGKELFFVQYEGLSAVSMTTQPTFTFGNPVAVFPKPTFKFPLPVAGFSREGASIENSVLTERSYDIMPDGKRFIGVVEIGPSGSGASAAPQIQVVLNWQEELKQRVPSR